LGNRVASVLCASLHGRKSYFIGFALVIPKKWSGAGAVKLLFILRTLTSLPACLKYGYIVSLVIVCKKREYFPRIRDFFLDSPCVVCHGQAIIDGFFRL
jgi:hypothetical protein